MQYTCDLLLKPADAGHRYLPEGPYDLGDGWLSWVTIQLAADVPRGALHRLHLPSGECLSHDLPGRPGFAFPTDRPGVFVIGLERSLGLFDTASGEWQVLVEGVDADVEGTIINDGVVFDEGLVFGCKDLEFKEAKAGLYLYRSRDRQLLRLRGDQVCSNGKVLQRGQQGWRLYDIDSPRKQVVSYRLDVEAGRLDDERMVLDFRDRPVFPDGMVEVPGGAAVIVAFYDPRDVAQGEARLYHLEDGRLGSVWTTPGSPRVTCPALVTTGDGVQLVLTTAVEGMSDQQLAQHRAAGCLFIGPTPYVEVPPAPRFSLA